MTGLLALRKINRSVWGTVGGPLAIVRVRCTGAAKGGERPIPATLMSLLIPLADLREAPGRKLRWEVKWESPLDWIGEQWKLLEPPSLKGEISLAGEEVRLEGELVARLEVVCSRCLAPVEFSYRVQLDEVISAPGQVEAVDLEPSVREAFYLELPARFLCREECRGLCSQCGHDLNQGDCGCRSLIVDPRLEVLSRLLRPED